ncbi:hypothetical protein ACTI_73120 [Actinoplanes sp. OR16]|uniref:hypothetical protein n=1 Tax=Actinoplanes sp. OR16 TaxID=946334 RepID=UPI000F6F51AE|nr:hypothetical protein [Actinoplanes sp. OR16]BBH70627.1 hypothetical protein ACTI_73120 [Actinoplanes sp. OR16]
MRVSTVARVVWGAALVIAPRVLLRAGGRADASPGAVAFARVLGARHLVQAAVPVHRWGVVVDAAHAVQQLTLAAASPRWRTAALVDAAVATALAGSARAFRE